MKSHEDRIFTRENFDNKSFSNDIFSDCTFKNSNLHLIKLDGCRFHNVIFEECKKD
jgi:uncharacterized protein YjbI with pentapeptide repeats